MSTIPTQVVPARPSRPLAELQRLSPLQRLVLASSSVMLAVGLTGTGVYATFTSSANASHTVSTATVGLALGTSGAPTNRLTVNATAMFPADVYYRSVDLTNSGSHALSAISLTTTASVSSLLDTDATNGLQMLLQRCSVAWTESGSSPNFTYTCSGATTSVLSTRAVIGAGLALTNITATAVSTTDHLLLSMTLPSTADNTFQGQTSTISFTFNGA